MAQDEVSFEPGVFLLLKAIARTMKAGSEPALDGGVGREKSEEPGMESPQKTVKAQFFVTGPEPELTPGGQMKILKVSGEIPPELWNRLGVKILPKLKSGTDLKIGVDFSATMDAALAQRIGDELKQILEDLDLQDKLKIE